MYDYVKNVSDKVIPESFKPNGEESRKLFQYQRRKHLQAWDDKYKRAPLDAVERLELEELETKIYFSQPVMIGGIEFKFKPGQIYRVPEGFGKRIVALRPDRLKVLSYEEAMADNRNSITNVHFQTKEDALLLLAEISKGMDRDGKIPPLLQSEDDVVSWNN